MCDFQPGDVVVWRPEGLDANPGQASVGNHGLSSGRNYTVSEVRYFAATDETGLRLSEAELPDPSWWMDARAFRRVYRPDGSFLRQCLEPVKEGA